LTGQIANGEHAQAGGQRQMSRYNILVSVVVLAAFASCSASSQTLGSQTNLGNGNPQVEALSRKALGGDTRAQLLLGMAFEFGQGVEKDLEEAMHWYRIAADRGDPEAQTNLGYLYETGSTGPENPVEAAKWYLRAAVSGFARAQFNLGTLYLRGEGVERSDQDAAHWIGEAADAGCPSAVKALGYLYAYGKGVPLDEQKARELIHKAAKKNDPRLCVAFSRNSADDGTLVRR
jgi:TPR repeat protein